MIMRPKAAKAPTVVSRIWTPFSHQTTLSSFQRLSDSSLAVRNDASCYKCKHQRQWWLWMPCLLYLISSSSRQDLEHKSFEKWEEESIFFCLDECDEGTLIQSRLRKIVLATSAKLLRFLRIKLVEVPLGFFWNVVSWMPPLQKRRTDGLQERFQRRYRNIQGNFWTTSKNFKKAYG